MGEWMEKTTARRRLGPLVLALLLGAAPEVFAQDHAPTLETIFKDLATDHSPGCAVGAARGDAPLAAKAFGLADLEHNIPLTPQSVFYMASVSKQFTSLSILLLERDGRLQLDDRARTHLPELPDYAADITIRQLLHHTSGLRDYLTLSGLAGNPPDQVITERSVLNALARQMRLNFEPGTEHLYSNTGYVLLSIIVHRVSGRPLDEFARERIFTPLGMRSTRFQHDHAAPIPGRAIGYVRRGSSWWIANSMLDVVGDGGMYSTVDDMLRWAAAFERPEFSPLLSRMQQPGTLKNGSAIANGYGMGLSQGTYRGVPTVSHGGSLAGYRTNFVRLPGEKLTVVTLCNNATASVGRLTEMVAELYAPAGMFPPAAATAAPAVPTAAPAVPTAPPQAPAQTAIPRELGQALAGVYYSAELEATYRIVAGSDAVTLEMGNNMLVALRLTGPDVLRTPQGIELRPVRDSGNRITGLTIGAGRVRDLAFIKR
jgi:CubicO group peptidase (beta-lactamase class C family)